MRVVGIDPGVSGAIALLDDSERIVCDLPTEPVSKGRQVDPVALSHLLTAWGPARVVIEDNRANGGNGSLANYSMGHSIGSIVAVVLLGGYPLLRIKPQDWQREVGLATVHAKDRKAASSARARELFPVLHPDLKRVADHNRAEALLIAEYGRRQP
jgi:crossover junction endodeoxyribonuclease RuvC